MTWKKRAVSGIPRYSIHTAWSGSEVSVRCQSESVKSQSGVEVGVKLGVSQNQLGVSQNQLGVSQVSVKVSSQGQSG